MSPKILVTAVTDISQQPAEVVDWQRDYVADIRPLCQGMPFVLTDQAHPRLVLKHGSHFLILDQSAHIPSCNTLGYGYYRYDTRHLSQWELYLNDIPLSLLSSDVGNGYAGTFLYTNPQTPTLAQQKITLERQIVLSDVLWERLSISNFDSKDVDIELTIKFQSDFADMFEVRGLNRPERGTRMMPIGDADGRKLYLAYKGLDDLLLETIIEFLGIKPDSIEDGVVRLSLNLPSRETTSFEISVTTKWQGHKFSTGAPSSNFMNALKQCHDQYSEWCSHTARVQTEHEMFDMALQRSFQDIYILRQPSPRGFGLAAGIPWYSAIFGRDSAIAALQMMPFMPKLARECIEVLAAYQGEKKDTFKAERPGKILHELRLGELSRTGLIPHSPYFGTVDATQLWLILFSRYIDWSGDMAFAKQMWPHVRASVSFLEEEAGDGFITYKRESPQGLENQGWKDSGDSVMYRDGNLAVPPIALCEPQAYLYSALIGVAKVAEKLGHTAYSRTLLQQAEALKVRFNESFWMEDEEFVALALDGEGKKANVISSNAGHCIWAGILNGDRANKVVDKMMSMRIHTGWGLRTLSANELAFNPISYHNGSVWPHDNAIIVEGMRKHGRTREAHQIMHETFEVALSQPEFRLPELFCGFQREATSKPIEYPVSCSPQAWAAGSLYQMLSANLNFEPEAMNNVLRIVDPALPPWLGKVQIYRLQIGASELDLAFECNGDYTFVQILRKSGNVRVIVES